MRSHERLSEKIGNHVFGVDVLDANVAGGDSVLNKKMSDVYMAKPSARLRQLRCGLWWSGTGRQVVNQICSAWLDKEACMQENGTALPALARVAEDQGCIRACRSLLEIRRIQ